MWAGFIWVKFLNSLNESIGTRSRLLGAREEGCQPTGKELRKP